MPSDCRTVRVLLLSLVLIAQAVFLLERGHTYTVTDATDRLPPASIILATVRVAIEHGSFHRYRQVAPHVLPSNTRFIGSPSPNGISIGSFVFAQYTQQIDRHNTVSETMLYTLRHAFNCTAWNAIPRRLIFNSPPSRGDFRNSNLGAFGGYWGQCLQKGPETFCSRRPTQFLT